MTLSLGAYVISPFDVRQTYSYVYFHSETGETYIRDKKGIQNTFTLRIDIIPIYYIAELQLFFNVEQYLSHRVSDWAFRCEWWSWNRGGGGLIQAYRSGLGEKYRYHSDRPSHSASVANIRFRTWRWEYDLLRTHMQVSWCLNIPASEERYFHVQIGRNVAMTLLRP